MFPVKHPDLDTYAGLLTDIAMPRGLVGFPASRVISEIDRSLALAQVTGTDDLPIDVGTGAGLPGVPLAIACGGGHLVEPRANALAFLEKVAREITTPLSLHHARAEDLQGILSGPVVVARALAPPQEALQLCAPLCAPGGILVLTAAPRAPVPAKDTWQALGFSRARSETLQGRAGSVQEVLVFSKP